MSSRERNPKIIPLQENRVYYPVGNGFKQFLLDRKLVTSDLVEIPKDHEIGLKEESQGILQSFRNSHVGQALQRKTLKPR